MGEEGGGGEGERNIEHQGVEKETQGIYLIKTAAG